MLDAKVARLDRGSMTRNELDVDSQRRERDCRGLGRKI